MLSEVSGDRLKEIGEYQRIKSILTDFLRGYPSWRYYGIFEYYFKEKAATIIQRLKEDEFIDTLSKDGKLYYWLTSKGVQLASSLNTGRKIDKLKVIALLLAGLGIVIGLSQLFLAYFQNPIF